MENHFRIEHIGRVQSCVRSRKGFIKVFKKTNENLPLLDINVEKRYAIFCADIEQHLEQIYNFEVRKDDVWVITMPKCGTTWMLEMVWMLVNNVDIETALKVDQSDRCPYLEYVMLNPSSNSVEEASNMKSPRVIKTHLPIHMLPKGLWTVQPKIVYVARDLKDAIVSYHHFLSKLIATSSKLENFVNEIVNEKTFFSSFWAHVAEFWNLRNESYVHFTSYERMKNDLRGEVCKVSKFLEKTVSNGELNKLVEHLTFDKMKNNSSCNNVKQVRELQNLIGVEEKPMGIYLRKGEVGSYKKELNEDLVQILDDWTQKSTKPYGITTEEILYS